MVDKTKLIKNVLSFVLLVDFLIGLPNIPADRVSFNLSGHILTQPYFRSTDLDSTSAHVKYAVISIHGSGRNADEHFNIINSAINSIGTVSYTHLTLPTIYSV